MSAQQIRLKKTALHSRPRPEKPGTLHKNAHYASQNSVKGKVLLFFTRARFKKNTLPLYRYSFFSFFDRKRLALDIQMTSFGTEKNILNGVEALEIKEK